MREKGSDSAQNILRKATNAYGYEAHNDRTLGTCYRLVGLGLLIRVPGRRIFHRTDLPDNRPNRGAPVCPIHGNRR